MVDTVAALSKRRDGRLNSNLEMLPPNRAIFTAMIDTKTRFRPTSWSCPTDDDNRAWDALTRDEQLEAMQALAVHSDTSTPTEITVDEIMTRVRADRAARAKHGPKL